MKVGFITTIDTNIGDDFIRTGIINLLKSTFHDQHLEFVLVNKHFPYTVYPLWHPMRYVPHLSRRGGRRLRYLIIKLFSNSSGSKFDNCDLIIQSGAPVLWPNCQECEWNIPIWQCVVGRLYHRTPVFNIAAGSCYPWENQIDVFTNPKEEEYAIMIGEFCRLTTTRDTLSHKLFSSANVKNTLMPCTAFFVGKHFENQQKGEYVLINYMKGAGHFDWNQNINADKWEQTLKDTIIELKRNHEVRFICHDNKEVELAKKLDATLKIHYPLTVPEYLECIQYAKLGINNRMHASVAMGSMGVPAISICTDTRLLMLENIGMPIFYVKDLEASELINTSNKLIAGFDAERKRLFDLKTEKFGMYKEIIEKFATKN